MGYNYANVERDGMTKIIALAKALCRIVSAFAHILRGKFPDSEPITVLLQAIEALCPLIAEAELAAIEYTGTNEVPLSDPAEILGINVGLDPAEDPEIA